jgi:hypothetical protein
MTIEALVINSNRVLLVDTVNSNLADFEQGIDEIFKPFTTHDLETPSRRDRIQKDLATKYSVSWQKLPRQSTMPDAFDQAWLDESMKE